MSIASSPCPGRSGAGEPDPSRDREQSSPEPTLPAGRPQLTRRHAAAALLADALLRLALNPPPPERADQATRTPSAATHRSHP